MKNLKTRLRGISWSLIGAALLWSGPSVFAQASLTLTGPGTNGVISNIYVGPYQGTVNGVATGIICDDFYDDSYFKEAWTATVSTLSNLTQTKFGSTDLNSSQPDGVATSITTEYEEAAWLAQQLVNPGTTCQYAGANCAGDIQYAIWQIFDSGQPFSLLTGNDLMNAESWLQAAESQTFSSGEFSDVTIYTPVSCSLNCNGSLPRNS